MMVGFSPPGSVKKGLTRAGSRRKLQSSISSRNVVPVKGSDGIDWIAALRHAGIEPAKLLGSGLPFVGTLLKKEQDMALVGGATGRRHWGQW